jgi:hypothetical protein
MSQPGFLPLFLPHVPLLSLTCVPLHHNCKHEQHLVQSKKKKKTGNAEGRKLDIFVLVIMGFFVYLFIFLFFFVRLLFPLMAIIRRILTSVVVI